MKYLREKEAEDFLEKEGFNVVKRGFVSSERGLRSILSKLGFPIVMKVYSRKIMHKDKSKGVKKNIFTYSDALYNFSVLSKLKGFLGVVVQQKIFGEELFLGVKKTPEFGHVILFGKGGVDVEKDKEIGFRVTPFDRNEARKMISEVVDFSLKNRTFVEGVIFLTLLAFFIARSFHISRKAQKLSQEESVESKYKLSTSLILVVGSCLGLILGAIFLVEGASGIARHYGVSERVISVSIIAFGTSVPELTTSIMAAIRKELDIFVGNIIGSNIFNILAILGITTLLTDIDINPKTVSFDYLWMIGVSALLFIFMLPLKKAVIGRWKGAVFVLIYASYIYLVYMK